jgi:transposase
MTSRYNEEFRGEAVRLVLENKVSMAQVARDLGVNIWTLRDWVRARRKSSGQDLPRRPETLDEENRRLKRELAVLKQEREILKKAAAYFAKEQR